MDSYTKLSSMRPNELMKIEFENIYLDQNYMIGGSKTEAGKNRIIPIHPAILDLVKTQIKISTKFGSSKLIVNRYGTDVRYETYRKCLKKCCELNIMEHKEHDPRKYFVTTAKKFDVNEYAIKLIIGHDIQDITEKVYAKRDPEWLYSEISKIKCMNNV